MQVGDKYIWKTKIGIDSDSWIWTIDVVDTFNTRYALKHVTDRGLVTQIWVNFSDLEEVFTKVDSDKDEESQTDWFGMLPTGMGNSPFYSTECVHDWQEYVGFRETYIYCTKCDKKQEIQK